MSGSLLCGLLVTTGRAGSGWVITLPEITHTARKYVDLEKIWLGFKASQFLITIARKHYGMHSGIPLSRCSFFLKSTQKSGPVDFGTESL